MWKKNFWRKGQGFDTSRGFLISEGEMNFENVNKFKRSTEVGRCCCLFGTNKFFHFLNHANLVHSLCAAFLLIPTCVCVTLVFVLRAKHPTQACTADMEMLSPTRHIFLFFSCWATSYICTNVGLLKNWIPLAFFKFHTRNYVTGHWIVFGSHGSVTCISGVVLSDMTSIRMPSDRCIVTHFTSRGERKQQQETGAIFFRDLQRMVLQCLQVKIYQGSGPFASFHWEVQ